MLGDGELAPVLLGRVAVQENADPGVAVETPSARGLERGRYSRAIRYTLTRLSSHAYPSGTGVRPSIHAVDGIHRQDEA
jgi:hypothetical protein